MIIIFIISFSFCGGIDKSYTLLTCHRWSLPGHKANASRQQKKRKKQPVQIVQPSPAPQNYVCNADIARQAKLAVLIIKFLGATGESFSRNWIAFNAFYNAGIGQSERDRLMFTIENGMTDGQAAMILDMCNVELHFLAGLPPGDMRRRPDDPDFRRRATLDLQDAMNTSLSSRTRLAHLVAAIYQVRCNLFHGAKNPKLPRSQELIIASNKIIINVLDVLVDNASVEDDS